MSWITPGEPYEIEVQGKTIKLKSLTHGERKKLADAVMKLKDEESSTDNIYVQVSEQIVSIEGVDGDVKEFLKYQPPKIVLEIWGNILQGGMLMEKQVKN